MAVSACPHRPPCDGCPRFGLPDIAPGALETLRTIAGTHGLPQVPVHSGPLTGFRHRARLAIRGRVGSPKIGLFEADSHRVVHVPSCRVHHPLINEVAAAVRAALVEAGVSCYSDRAHLGLARYLQVVVERRSNTAQVVLVVNTTNFQLLTPCLELIRARLGPRLHSLWLNFNPLANNVILTDDFHHYCGPDSVAENFGGADVHYPPGAFGQSNLEVAQQIVSHLRAAIKPGARVCEFYAGVGAIGLSLLELVEAVHMNEVGAQSLRGMQIGIAGLTGLARSRVKVTAGTAGASCSISHDATVVIVDPPRKGLDPALTQHLAQNPPDQLLYVSCGLTSFVHDLNQLLSAQRMRLIGLTAFNLLPFTHHVETVAHFQRT